MLFDLLTGKEEQAEAYTRHLRFDIPFLANRLVAATRWVIERQAMNQRPIGYFGSSTGAGAALLAAAEPDNAIIAIVSRGGRPDLAGEALGRVKAPTLLIVGGNDETVITLNQEAREQLHAESDLKIVPAASHLFEEPGTLDLVAQMASDWFVRHFKKPRPF
jgi:dienelactone hydrolase